MKYLLLLCFFLICQITLSGQNNSGTILYEDKVNIHKSLPDEMEDLKERIPEFRTVKKLLHFTSEEAFYMNKPKDENEEQEFRGSGHRRGMRMRMGGGRSNEKFYTNVKERISIDERNFFGKDFLISGQREALKWKITGEQKQVGSYLCQKATFQDSTTNIVAWFTPMIPVSTGPDNYFGLPGLILHIDIDDSNRTITAVDIALKTLDEGLIIKPTKGKKVTQEEFEKIREEKMKEMEDARGESGGRFMFSRGK